MKIIDIFKSIKKKGLEFISDPNFGKKVVKMIDTGKSLSSSISNNKTNERKKINDDIDKYLAEAPIRRKRYEDLHNKVVNQINKNIKRKKYKTNRITGDLDYHVLNEAEKILTKDDYDFYEKQYNRYHQGMRCFADALKTFLNYEH